ncbi:MAG: hypothetical protein JWQ48_2038 [Conexibacter sp.]|jgi:hypothetical protein|nr:hypothetical protein [Conexibacter sp.]
MKKSAPLTTLVLLAGIGLMAKSQMPEVQRYLRVRQM